MKKPELPPETDTHYFYLKPVYKRYKTIKIADYCECCSHKTGSHEEERGVGLLKYEVIKEKKDAQYYSSKVMSRMMRKMFEDQFFGPTILDRLKNKEEQTKIVKPD